MADAKVDVYLSEPHYARHLDPIVRALPFTNRGKLYASRPAHMALARFYPGFDGMERVTGHPGYPGSPVLVASGDDARHVSDERFIIHAQHGVGQRYADVGDMDNGAHGYVGGPGLERVGLFLCVTPDEAFRWRQRYPGALHFAVGAPTLDKWHGVDDVRVETRRQPPLIGVSFHWPCNVSVEAGSAWSEWKLLFQQLAHRDHPYAILGHEHPRNRGRVNAWWGSFAGGIAISFDDVMWSTEAYVCDNSSTMFEYAAVSDRPVIGLRSHKWRTLDHGLRFGDLAPPTDLKPDLSVRMLDEYLQGALQQPSIVCPPEWHQRVRDEVYGGMVDGNASRRAADAILEVIA